MDDGQTRQETEEIESNHVNTDGFDLNLKHMTAKTKDFSFLTKFMTNFKQIKNVDIGKAKMSSKELGEMTRAIQKNPYI